MMPLVSFSILIFAILLSSVKGQDDNSCDRLCYEKGPSKICSYNFEVTYSQTMSQEHGCGDCPTNMTHCYSPSCISGDGRQRPIYLVNNQFPGPSITVCEGDQVVINVTNRLISAESITLHWHGIYHHGTPYMDGTPMITQCPIPMGTTFQYRWTAEPAGTKFWHAHTSFHRADGLVGPLIVRPRVSMDNTMKSDRASMSYRASQVRSNRVSKVVVASADTSLRSTRYDFGGDVSRDQGNVLIVQEWKRDPSPIHYVQDDEDAFSLLVNGRQGTNPASAPTYTLIRFARPPAPNNRTYAPLLRVISNGFLFCPVQMHLEGHRLKVIAADGITLQTPATVDVITIFPGERFDLDVLKGPNHDSLAAYTRSAKEKARGFPIKLVYAMRWWALGDCTHEHITANATSYIIAYEGDSMPAPNIIEETLENIRKGRGAKSFNHVEFLANNMGSPDFRILNPVHEVDFKKNSQYVPIQNLKPMQNNEIVQKSIKDVGYKIYLFTDSYLLGDDIPMFNNISFQHPSAPLLSQYYDVPDKELCNYNTHPHCSEKFCSCTHMYEIELGAVVEVVLVDEGLNGEYDIHSIHLHGYSFAVLAQEKIGQNVSIHDIKRMDAMGKLRRNLDNPVYKDSVAIPEGGYTIIRFVADNPGFWMLHCHLDFHFLKGMALILKVGDVSEMPKIPAGFPKCGSWFTQDSNMSPNRWKAFKP